MKSDKENENQNLTKKQGEQEPQFKPSQFSFPQEVIEQYLDKSKGKKRQEREVRLQKYLDEINKKLEAKKKLSEEEMEDIAYAIYKKSPSLKKRMDEYFSRSNEIFKIQREINNLREAIIRKTKITRQNKFFSEQQAKKILQEADDYINKHNEEIENYKNLNSSQYLKRLLELKRQLNQIIESNFNFQNNSPKKNKKKNLSEAKAEVASQNKKKKINTVPVEIEKEFHLLENWIPDNDKYKVFRIVYYDGDNNILGLRYKGENKIIKKNPKQVKSLIQKGRYSVYNQSLKDEIKNKYQKAAINKLKTYSVQDSLNLENDPSNPDQYLYDQAEIDKLAEQELSDRIKVENNKIDEKIKRLTQEDNEIATYLEKYKDKDDETRLLMALGFRKKKKMKIYLEKEYESNKKLKGIFKFFKRKLNLENFQEEEEQYKKDYQKAVQEYVNEIIRSEGIKDPEEAEILARYLKAGEFLKLREGRVSVALEKNPSWHSFKSVMKKMVLGYDQMMQWPVEKISQWAKKNGFSNLQSKLLGTGGKSALVWGIFSATRRYTSYSPFLLPLKIGMISASVSATTIKESEKNIQAIENQNEKVIENQIQNLLANLKKQKEEKMSEILATEFAQTLNLSEKEKIKKIETYLNTLAKTVGKTTLMYLAGYGLGKYIFDGEQHSTLHNSTEQTSFHHHNDYNKLETNSTEINAKATSLNHSNHLGNDTTDLEANSSMGKATPETNSIVNATETASANNSNLEHLSETKEVTFHFKKGESIEKVLKEYLKNNSDKFHEGRWGWDPEKYESLEEWAGKRAHIIAQEYAHQNPEENLNWVSEKASFKLDISNPADIKIETIEDPYDLATHHGSSSGNLANETNAEKAVDFKGQDMPKADIEKLELTAKKIVGGLRKTISGNNLSHWNEIKNSPVFRIKDDQFKEAQQALQKVLGSVASPSHHQESLEHWTRRMTKELIVRGKTKDFLEILKFH